MPTDDGYPTEQELEHIRTWSLSDPTGWFDFIESCWWAADWGWSKEVTGKVATYHVSTSGWSGNEEIIDAMQTTLLWTATWISTHRGGHFTFQTFELERG